MGDFDFGLDADVRRGRRGGNGVAVAVWLAAAGVLLIGIGLGAWWLTPRPVERQHAERKEQHRKGLVTERDETAVALREARDLYLSWAKHNPREQVALEKWTELKGRIGICKGRCDRLSAALRDYENTTGDTSLSSGIRQLLDDSYNSIATMETGLSLASWR